MARRWAARLMARWSRWVFAAGVVGISGFLASLVALSQRWLGTLGSIALIAASLTLYAAALLVGYLAEAWSAPHSAKRWAISPPQQGRGRRSPIAARRHAGSALE